MSKYRLHQEAQEILPLSQRCCASEVIAGPAGGLFVPLARSLDTGCKQVSGSCEFKPVSAVWHIQSLYLDSGVLYFQLCRGVGAQPRDLALGNCTVMVNPLPNNAREECLKRKQLEIVAFLLASELLWGLFPHLMLPFSCMPGILAVYLPNS